MKNLENYGVLEMNAKEITEIDGGSKLAQWFGYTIGYIDGSMQEFSQFLNDTFV